MTSEFSTNLISPEMLKMRILMVEHSGGGGMYAYTDALCNGLYEAGADVTVLTSSKWPDEPRPFKVERELITFTAEQGKSSRLHWAIDRAVRCTTNCIRRNRFINERQFDVVHFQGAGMPLLDQFFLKPLAKNIPVVMTVHDIQSHDIRFISKPFFVKRSLRIPHCLIVHYERGKQKLIDDWRINKQSISVIPHGIIPIKNPVDLTIARRKLNLPEKSPVLLFFGKIRDNKGLKILLKAMDKIRNSFPEVLLVIAGTIPRGLSFEPYSQIIDELKLSGNIRTFLHFIKDEDIDSFFAAADIVVLPYLKFESQSGVLLRTYANKKPVVTSNVGAMGELVVEDKTGLTVQSSSVEALADAIIAVLNNPEEFSSHYNQKLEEKYKWEKIAAQTLNCYKKAIEIKTP